MQIISDALRSRWGANEIRALVLASLIIQISLIFLSPMRKRSAGRALALAIWLFYVTSDYISTLALGNIITNQTYNNNSSVTIIITDYNNAVPGELAALWAPFLLLHLGGPDTITSYSIDDNELWWRHLLGLFVQVVIAGFVFLLQSNLGLWIPTVLVFVPGVIKFVERTVALRLGSLESLKDRIVSELGPGNETKVDFISTSSNTPNTETELISEGYGWFNIFKRLLVDVPFSSDLLIQSQDRFSDITSTEAFKLVSIELSFFYDILHTKAAQIHSFLGLLLRCTSFLSILAALVMFWHADKQKYSSKDVIVTYVLFGAAIGVEIIGGLIMVFSDWTVASVKRTKWWKYFAVAGTVTAKLATVGCKKPRWSGTIGQYNLVNLCLRDRNTLFARIMRKLKIKRKWDDLRETKSVPLPESLIDVMHAEAKRRAQNVHLYDVLVEARSYRGSKALDRHSRGNTLGWSLKKEFDACVILWHIATDICFYNDPSENESERIVSYMMSNYMVYLLKQRPSMLQIGYGQKRFEDTCSAVRAILYNNGQEINNKIDDNKKARQLLDDKTRDPDNNNNLIEGDGKGASVLLFDGCRLARELQELDRDLRWRLISETWVEMMAYAAIHCESSRHVRSLSRGGELLTHFWLLLNQMGIVEECKMQQFQSVLV